jgi:Glyoxalase/Bleomycin resistance protein/Dioxygenase superfamily
MLLDFGQPPNGIAQVAYVVSDIDAAQAAFTVHLRVGPWFVRGPFTPPEGRLRGEPNSPTLTLARGFCGHTMVELIAQHDDGPSVYHEEQGQRRYGFHHWATISRDFDHDIARYAEAGFVEAYYDVLPSGSRVMYVDSTSELPGMVEVIEYTAEQERVYTDMYRAALSWRAPEEVPRAHG